MNSEFAPTCSVASYSGILTTEIDSSAEPCANKGSDTQFKCKLHPPQWKAIDKDYVARLLDNDSYSRPTACVDSWEPCIFSVCLLLSLSYSLGRVVWYTELSAEH